MKTLSDYIAETIRRYGAVGSSRATGFTLEEESDEELEEDDASSNDPLLAKTIDDAAVEPMEESVNELELILSRAKLRD